MQPSRLGHSRIQMVLRYAHPTDEHQTQSMRRLKAFTERARLEN